MDRRTDRLSRFPKEGKLLLRDSRFFQCNCPRREGLPEGEAQHL